jgi:hypothetical protein
MNTNPAPDLILHNGKITTLDPKHPEAKNLAIKEGRIVGVDDAETYQRSPETKLIDLRGHLSAGFKGHSTTRLMAPVNPCYPAKALRSPPRAPT